VQLHVLVQSGKEESCGNWGAESTFAVAVVLKALMSELILGVGGKEEFETSGMRADQH
jgi:hypothetical protein